MTKARVLGARVRVSSRWAFFHGVRGGILLVIQVEKFWNRSDHAINMKEENLYLKSTDENYRHGLTDAFSNISNS
jgi:hypothetical protein